MNLDRLRGVTHDAGNYDALLEMIGDADIVCIGEASHGTHEFYRERAKITKRLIDERGFNAVAVEADWPDAYRVNRYVRAESEDEDADEALDGFKSRFPTWMWRNADVLDFVGWLRGFNDAIKDGKSRVGFYGVVAHIGRDRRARLVIWEHNSHLGDARFTEMSQQGELNVGQLMRERYGDRAMLIGFSTYTDTVTAADDWDGPARRKRVNPGLRGSYEDVLHQVSPANYYLTFRGGGVAAGELAEPRLQRFDETRAVEPLERLVTVHDGEVAETFPSGV